MVRLRMEAVAILIAIGRLHLVDANDCFNNDLDSYGNDIGSAIKDVSSAAACQKLCNSNADCNYFTYGKTVYSGNCWLKSKKMTPLTSAPGLISGPKTCPKFDPCLLQDKYLGGYAGGARNAFSTMENAMAECLRVDDCGGLTYEQTPAEWTLRVQTTPKQSPSQEISILRTCYEKPDLICHDLYKHSDVGFIMDVSGSVGGHWADEKSFVMDLVRTFDLFPNGAHAAVTTFSSTASLVIKFQEHTTTDDFEAALEALPSPSGGTEIGIALDVAINEMFQELNGMRLDSPKVAVLITDGDSNSAVDYAGFRNLFRGAHIKLLVVGIGNVNENDLLELVETPDDLLLVTDFAALDVTDFVEHTTFCEPDACACEAPLRQKLDQMNSKLDLLTEMIEAIGNHVVPGKGWNVQLDGSTKLSGTWINNGNPIPATIAYHVHGNVFIIAAVRGSHLKMVKIAVTGETTFVWIDAKYHDPSATSSCRDQDTFSESCFHGKSVSKGQYNVQLVASSGSG